MARGTLFGLAAAACLLTACSEPHLEIFPPLEDESLTEQKLDPADLKKDVDAFYFGTLERHPSIRDYADQALMQATLHQIKANLTEPLTRVEFFREVGKLTHTFGDGHSMLIWPYQEFQHLQDSGTIPFPFRVHIDQQDRILVKETYRDNKGALIPAGSRITSINGMSVAGLLESMQRYVGGETAYLRKQFVAARFPIYAWAVHGIAGDFSLSFETPDTATPNETHTVAINNDANWTAETANQQQEQDFYYKTLDTQTAYLHVGHFDVDPDWFEDFIDEAFTSFRTSGATALIVDIRSNTGGNTDTAQYLAQHLADREFRMVSEVREKLNQDNRGLFGYKGSAGDIITTKWDDWLDPADDSKRFDGDIYVLISPITYSSGIVFASTVKDFGFATLIGQETGGNANQTAQGNLFNLPHSQLRAYVTTRMLVRPSGSLAPGGVKPDYTVYATQESLHAGIDVELNQALELIQNKRSNTPVEKQAIAADK